MVHNTDTWALKRPILKLGVAQGAVGSITIPAPRPPCSFFKPTTPRSFHSFLLAFCFLVLSLSFLGKFPLLSLYLSVWQSARFSRGRGDSLRAFFLYDPLSLSLFSLFFLTLISTGYAQTLFVFSFPRPEKKNRIIFLPSFLLFQTSFFLRGINSKNRIMHLFILFMHGWTDGRLGR